MCQNCQTVCNFDPSGAFCGVPNQCYSACGVQCWSVGYETGGGGSYGPGGCSGKYNIFIEYILYSKNWNK